MINANSKRIKLDAQKQTAEKKEDAESSESKAEDNKQTVKQIIEENSIDVENYIKTTFFDEEIKKNEEVEDVQFEEVSKQEVVQSVEQENEEQAIVIGKKQASVHIFEEDEDEDMLIIHGGSLNQMSNDDGDEVLINKNSKSFEVIDIEEQTKAEKIKEEINNLSPEAKAVLLTGLFDKKE
jgi:hypothetical protein